MLNSQLLSHVVVHTSYVIVTHHLRGRQTDCVSILVTSLRRLIAVAAEYESTKRGLQLDATTKPNLRSKRRGRQDTLGVIARLVADDLPLADLFSRLAAFLDNAIGPAYIEL